MLLIGVESRLVGRAAIARWRTKYVVISIRNDGHLT